MTPAIDIFLLVALVAERGHSRVGSPVPGGLCHTGGVPQTRAVSRRRQLQVPARLPHP